MEIKTFNYILLNDLLKEIKCSSEMENSIIEWLDENFSYGDDTLSFIYLDWILEEFKNNKIVENINFLELPNNLLIKIS